MDRDAALEARLAALEELVARQAATIEEQGRRFAARPELVASPSPVPPLEPEGVGRRQLLGSLGKVAAGAVAGGAAAVLASSQPAAAAPGSFSVTDGTVGLTATSNTSVSGSGTGIGVVGTASGTSSTISIGLGSGPIGVAGASTIGVKGFGSGTALELQGVQGEGGTGRGGVFFGSRADLQVGNGSGVSGPSRSNSGGGHVVGELAMQSNGDLWVAVATTANNAAGSWKRMAYREGGAFEAPSGAPAVQATSTLSTQPAVRGQQTSGAANQVGVLGSSLSGGGAGVRGECTGGGVLDALTSGVLGSAGGGGAFGVSGICNGGGGTGVYGVASKFGVRGRVVNSGFTVPPPPDVDAAGVVAEGLGSVLGIPVAGVRATSVAGVGGQFTGAASNVHLVAGTAGPLRSHTFGHAVGELAMEVNGTVWVCVAAGGTGQPGAWKRVAFVEDLPPGFDPGTLTGVFSAPPKPGRVYDSRIADGKIGGGQSRNVSVATTLDGSEIVPAGASAAVFTITLDQTEGAGFLSVFPSNVAFPGTSSINWFTNGQIVANGGTVTVPADRTVTVLAGGAGSTHFILDIAGVYT